MRKRSGILASAVISIVCGIFIAVPAIAAETWGIGRAPNDKPRQHLQCSPGTFLAGARVRQGEWLAHVTLYCASLSADGSRGELSQGADAGGNGGDHESSLFCPTPSVIGGIRGLRTHVALFGGVGGLAQDFAADPRFECIRPGSGVVAELGDPSFKRSTDPGTKYAGFESLLSSPSDVKNFDCFPDWAATGIWLQTDPSRGDDIAELGLVCERLPATGAIGNTSQPNMGETPHKSIGEMASSTAASSASSGSPVTAQAGLRVTSGTYGGNCGQPEGNMTGPLASACNGKSFCQYTVDYKVIGDPAPGCAKDYVAKWTCGGGEQVARANAEAGLGSIVGLMCQAMPQAPEERPLPSSGGVSIVSGTYGGNCGQPEGNVTGHLATACNGKSSCQYSVDYKVIGDPSPGCKKDYVAKWTCGGMGVQTARSEAEAGFGSIVAVMCQ